MIEIINTLMTCSSDCRPITCWYGMNMTYAFDENDAVSNDLQMLVYKITHVSIFENLRLTPS